MKKIISLNPLSFRLPSDKNPREENEKHYSRRHLPPEASQASAPSFKGSQWWYKASAPIRSSRSHMYLFRGEGSGNEPSYWRKPCDVMRSKLWTGERRRRRPWPRYLSSTKEDREKKGWRGEKREEGDKGRRVSRVAEEGWRWRGKRKKNVNGKVWRGKNERGKRIKWIKGWNTCFEWRGKST